MGASIAMAMLTGSWALPVPTARAEGDPAAKCYATSEALSPDQRVAACTAAIEASPVGLDGWIDAHLRRADAYFKKNELDLAIADYDQIIRHVPDNIIALICRASLYVRKRNMDLAFADYARAIDINPRLTSVYAARGDAYQIMGDLDHAIADYERALQINSRGVHANAHAHVSLGVAYRLKGDLDRALVECNRGIDLAADEWRGYICRGEIFEDKGDFELALADFNRAAQINSKDLRPHWDMVHVYRRQGKLDLVLAEIGQIIASEPQNPRHYYSRALVRFQLGQLHEARADVDKSYELDPRDAYTNLWRDILRKRMNQPSQLAEDSKQLDMAKWPAPVVRLFLGEMTVDAVLAAADDPNPNKRKGQLCEANFYAGELALQRGATEEAVRLLRLTANDCPKNFIEWSAAVAELRVLEPNR